MASYRNRDVERMIREGLDGLDYAIAAISHSPPKFRVDFRLQADRWRSIELEVKPGPGLDKILQVSCYCCPAEPRHFELLLRLNAEMTYSRVAIRDLSGCPAFVMTHCRSLRAAAPEEIRAAVLEMAQSSDWIKRLLGSSA